MKCVSCGGETNDLSVFCEKCGANLKNDQPQQNNNQQNNQNPYGGGYGQQPYQHGGYGQQNQNPYGGYNQYPQGGYNQYPQSGFGQPYQQDAGKGKAIASMVLGILSIVCCYVGFILGIIAIVLGSQSKKTQTDANQPTGMATAGLITGIIGTIIWVMIDILYLFLSILSIAWLY